MTDDNPIDGAELAILSNRFEGVARKMANTLLRAGRSGVLNRARDFSACIVTADDQLLSAAESLPIHVLSGPDLMAASMKALHPEFRAGDAFLHNSPYHGCSHPADHSILMPVMDGEGAHRFTVVVKAHQADIGNAIPTTYHGSARDVYEEGALIFPAVQVQRDYRTIADIVRMCEMRIRVPEQWKGDFLAMLGAARTGEQEILALAREIGWERLDAFAERWLDYSEQRMTAAIGTIPSGRGTATSTHDPMSGTPADGVVIRSTVEVDASRGRIVVDLTDNPDCMPCGLNLSEACARTSALIGVFNSIGHNVPKNAGAFRRVDVRLREECIAGIPRHPTSCSAATTNIADRVCSATQGAMAAMADGIGMAEVGAGLSPASGVVSGDDPRTGKRFINQLFLGGTGGAATAHGDAWLTYLHAGNAGLCFIDSVELDEMCQPIRVHSRRLMPDTEGAGRLRGAPGLAVEFGPVDCAIDVAFVSDGTVNGAKGVRGGGTAGRSSQHRRTRSGELKPVAQSTVLRLEAGETVLSVSCGGGGYGEPRDRDPALVRQDVAERWISRDRARDVYGFDENGKETL